MKRPYLDHACFLSFPVKPTAFCASQDRLDSSPSRKCSSLAVYLTVWPLSSCPSRFKPKQIFLVSVGTSSKDRVPLLTEIKSSVYALRTCNFLRSLNSN